jgi:hypothetical protein
VQVAGVTCHATARIVIGVGDLLQRTGNGHIDQVLGVWTVERLGDAVCGLQRAREDEERRFLS